MTKIYKVSDRGPVEEHEYMLKMNFPKKLAQWDVWDYWEKERFFSMMLNVKPGDIFFDIGAEFGAISAMIQKYLRPRMVLFEPTREFFDSIKLIWEMNNLEEPEAIFHGFVSDKTPVMKVPALYWKDIEPREIEAMAYLNLNNESQREKVPTVTVDDYVGATGLIPRVLNIDVEGAEILVINGAVDTLKKYKPLVWLSIHSDLIKGYNSSEEKLIKKMKSLNYSCELLAVDHEKHYFCR